MGGRRRGWLRPAADVVLVVVLGLFLVAVVLDEHDRTRAPLLILLGLPFGVGQAVALYWRRARPVAVFAAALVGGLVLQLLVPTIAIPIAALIAIISLAAARAPALSLLALLALLGLCAVDFASASREDTYFVMVVSVAAWAIGEIARNRRVAIEGEARRAVAEERSRIAREIHDVVAHSVSVIIVQAAAADDVFDTRPDQARKALRSIETTGRDALAELRRLLAVVRPGAEDADPLRPQPGLARVDELAEPLRAAGLDVTIHTRGTARPLPAGVDVSAYRIVGEALTNALRHAHASRVEVTLTYTATTLDLDIADDGVGTGGGHHDSVPSTMPSSRSGGAAAQPGRDGGAPAVTAAGLGVAGGGHGIIGMRERTAMLGGSLDIGPRDDGGFRVRASLPLPADTGRGAGR
ncbi:sensor histidine kinase [Frankia sp. AgKG'84/4]